MLVYGDPWRTIDVRRWRDRAGALAAASWIERHAEIAARLIETGQILQTLEDEAFAAARGQDRADPAWAALKAHLLQLARALALSLERGETPDLAPPPTSIRLPDTLRAREPEGYAFYALYPEAYAQAACALGRAPDALVIGLRSIGASLAPMVAARVGAADFVTLRPKGSPFARTIEAPRLAADLAKGPARDVLIVDEGPGLSGSSFASVAHFVRAAQPHSRIALLPSHDGRPGAEAAPETQALFDSVPRLVAPFAQTLPRRLPGWVEDLTGRALGPLQDLSGGAWRRHLYASEAQWPAVDPAQERLKYLLHAERGAFLLKFTGLGDIGRRKARLAQRLGDAKLAPQTLGLRHGFLVTRWRDDARPLDLRRDRARLWPALARYLAFRQQHFACADAFGASPAELRAMTARNVALALGDAAGARAAARLACLGEPASVLRQIATDNRMTAPKWLVTADGDVLKTDGVDHHAGHDLIGAQDIAWDLAAAAVEFDMSAAELDDMRRQIARESGHRIESRLIPPYRLAWLAFELGRVTLARNSCAATPDAARLGARLAALIEKLARELA